MILPARSNNRSTILFFVSIIVWFNTASEVSVKLTQIKNYNHKQDDPF